MSEVKYRHPFNRDLEWSGRGKQPMWVTHAIAGGLTQDQLLVENQAAQQNDDDDLDLGIGDTAPAVAPTIAENLYAQRIVAGQASEPGADDPVYTAGTQTQVARLRQEFEAKPVTGEVTSAQPATEQEGRDLVNQLLGQAQAFAAASGLLRTFGVSKIAYVKENKLYKGLAGMRTPNGSEFSGTWEEFCSLIDVSVDKADTDIANLRAFGEEALESMSRMGIGYRELRQFRKLPPDQREALAQIALTGNKDDVLEAAMDAIEKERQAKGELEIKHAEQAEDLRQAQRRAKNLDAECERMESQIKRLSAAKSRVTDFLDRTEDIRAECLALQAEAELPIAAIEKLFIELCAEEPGAPEWRQQAEQVWITAHVIAARAAFMINEVREAGLGFTLPDHIEGTHILTPAEAQRWLLDYPMIENRHAAEAAARQEKRDAAKPKGPGRPKGSTNKAAEE